MKQYSASLYSAYLVLVNYSIVEHNPCVSDVLLQRKVREKSRECHITLQTLLQPPPQTLLYNSHVVKQVHSIVITLMKQMYVKSSTFHLGRHLRDKMYRIHLKYVLSSCTYRYLYSGIEKNVVSEQPIITRNSLACDLSRDTSFSKGVHVLPMKTQCLLTALLFA